MSPWQSEATHHVLLEVMEVTEVMDQVSEGAMDVLGASVDQDVDKASASTPAKPKLSHDGLNNQELSRQRRIHA